MAIKKNWYEIEAPAFFGNQVIGETPASDPKYLIGRTVSMSLADLNQDARRFYIKFNFRIVEADGRAKTIFAGHDVTYERIYRMVQRHSRRVDSVRDVRLSDGALIRVKTVLMIPKRVSTSVKDSVRKKMNSAVEKVLSSSTTDNFIRMIIDGSLQSAIREECKKVYPVGPIEIRKSEVLEQPAGESAGGAGGAAKKEAGKKEAKPKIKTTGRKKEKSGEEKAAVPEEKAAEEEPKQEREAEEKAEVKADEEKEANM